MGRNLTPTAILDAKGTFIADPYRARPAEPKGQRPLGGPPKWLTKEEKQVWKQLAKEILPGVAFESDRTMFAELVVLTTVFQDPAKRPSMKAAERALRLSVASRFALTPADRSRVSSPPAAVRAESWCPETAR
jgi:phage terminase small subunit